VLVPLPNGLYVCEEPALDIRITQLAQLQCIDFLLQLPVYGVYTR
jgi:hypothetical protein